MAGSAFVPVSGTTLDLVDLKVTGYDPFDTLTDEGGAYGEVNLQTLTDRGRTEDNYFWNDFIERDYDGNGNDRTWYGWYADGEEEAIDDDVCPIKPGEGLLIKCESYDYDYTFVWPKVDVK